MAEKKDLDTYTSLAIVSITSIRCMHIVWIVAYKNIDSVNIFGMSVHAFLCPPWTNEFGYDG